MPNGFRPIFPRFVTVVLASAWLVHWPFAADWPLAQSRGKSRVVERGGEGRSGRFEHDLPRPVAEIRTAILEAVASGDIAEMQTPLEWNELKPEVAAEPVTDIIAFWRRISADGSGRDILAILGTVLEQPHAVLPIGRDAENNRLYVWPRFSEVAEAQLTDADRAARDRLVPAAVRKEMARRGRYLWWRLAIGADGTWHSFRMAE
jgi:hypothetical protein